MPLRKLFVYPFVVSALVGGLAGGSARGAEPGTVLITGANRGLGLELARQLNAQGHTVIGTAREPEQATDLRGLGVRVEQLDVADPASVAALAQKLDGVAIDLLINNAGFFNRQEGGLADLDFSVLEHTLAVNTLGPLRTSQALLPNLRLGRGRTIVNITSQMGSLTTNGGGYLSYRTSKAALNQATVTLARELEGEGFTCVVLHPGWVRTRMGGQGATYSPAESAEGLLEVIHGLTPADTGRFLDLHGEELKW